MNLLPRFTEFITRENLFTSAHTLIIALSGGVDSIVLTDLCVQSGYKILLAHCNFGLRAAMSEGDEAFVRAYAMDRNLRLEIKQFDTSGYAEANKVSVQVAARELRYAWFDELLEQEGGEKKARIITGHHLDDNTETMLMNFFKGTGIAGLRGIRPLNGPLARPLLFARKEELVEYATANNLSWRHDQSNEENKYTRNFFRNQLIPLISSVFPEAETNLAANQRRFAGIEVLYRESVERHTRKLLLAHGSGYRVPVRALLLSPAPETIAWEIFGRFGFSPSAVPGILKLCASESGRYLVSATHRVIRNRNWLVIAAAEGEKAQLLVLDSPGTYPFPEGTLTITRELFNGQELNNGPSVTLADAASISFPLLLRPAAAGDYFYPLGMKKKKKKLARFLIDQKMSRIEKEKVWVVESAKRIVWVAGLRPDDRFRIGPATTAVLRLTLAPHNNPRVRS